MVNEEAGGMQLKGACLYILVNSATNGDMYAGCS